MDRGSDLAKNKKPKHRLQKFRPEWLKNQLFKMWLMPNNFNEYEAYYKFCKQTIKSERIVLKNHALSKKHKAIM
ncbi:Uncharacterized protein FWK35_00028708 [Aphis craccivora]|uniref:Uncharacterized protein n=1 Tax=Aphis craccivora TaxID=307492 RepID=A0A6G0VYP5_APHCR|nr:Uncharacterized protein FWK35_00026299 [Aphis craccivora]KAF0712738.1 Uncharacterized protein FWK35_00028708 [Aphis craccivora]